MLASSISGLGGGSATARHACSAASDSHCSNRLIRPGSSGSAERWRSRHPGWGACGFGDLVVGRDPPVALFWAHVQLACDDQHESLLGFDAGTTPPGLVIIDQPSLGAHVLDREAEILGHPRGDRVRRDGQTPGLLGLVLQVATPDGALVGVEDIPPQRVGGLALVELAGDLATIVRPGQIPCGIHRPTQRRAPTSSSGMPGSASTGSTSSAIASLSSLSLARSASRSVSLCLACDSFAETA